MDNFLLPVISHTLPAKWLSKKLTGENPGIKRCELGSVLVENGYHSGHTPYLQCKSVYSIPCVLLKRAIYAKKYHSRYSRTRAEAR